MYTIRKMEAGDRQAVKNMMRTFYASPAVLSNGSEEIFDADIDQCLGASPYLEGFVFEDSEEILGYAMIAKSFSTEFGKPCIWIEDLYIKDGHRDAGIGTGFLEALAERYPDCVHRLEVEDENKNAIRVYRRNGFDFLPYMEMKR